MSWDRGLKMGRLLASFGMERWLRVPLMLSLTKGWNFNSPSILIICVEYITGTLPIFPMIRSIEWLGRVCRLELSSNNIFVILITLSFEKARVHGFLLFLTHLSCITAFCVSVSFLWEFSESGVSWCPADGQSVTEGERRRRRIGGEPLSRDGAAATAFTRTLKI